MYQLLVKIFVSLFILKKYRASVKYSLLGLPNRIKVRKRAKSVGENFKCSGINPINVTKNTTIGKNVILNGINIIGCGDVTIGDYTKIGAECLICSENHTYEGETLPIVIDTVNKPVIIDKLVWIGIRTTILPGTHIGEGAIIQAGSVVHGEIPPCSIAGGNPAKVFKMRNMEHYNKIKKEGKFI